MPPEEVAKCARAIIEKAKSAAAIYRNTEVPRPSERSKLAAHAIRLAKLDSVYRAGRLDPHFQDAAPEDVEDLLAMVAIVPLDSLLHPDVVLLNPSFSESSELVGGADADLIVGDLLVDVKATKKPDMKGKDLDCLLGYFLLARHRRRADPTFPEIRRVAFYFARHALLWPLVVTVWTEHPDFLKIEEWFFDRAKQVFGRQPEPAEIELVAVKIGGLAPAATPKRPKRVKRLAVKAAAKRRKAKTAKKGKPKQRSRKMVARCARARRS
jgi:hypothetical protein